MLNLFEDENYNKINNKSFKANLKELFKKYDYLSVDIDNNIYGIKKDIKELIKNDPEAYSTANDLIV
jgi:recombinational DNA repair protein RecT